MFFVIIIITTTTFRRGQAWEKKICSKLLQIFVLNAFIGGNQTKEEIIPSPATLVILVVKF
jgi:hypothetical protein